MNRNWRKINHQVMLLLGIGSVFVLCSLLFFLDFYRQNMRYVIENTYKVLHEASMHQMVTFKARLDGQREILDTLGNNLQNMEDVSLETVLELADNITQKGIFRHIGIVDVKTGLCYYNNGEVRSVLDRAYYEMGIQGEVSIEHVSSKITGTKVIVLSAPIWSEEGKVEKVVVGSYETSDLANLLISEAYDRSSYSYICDAEGNIVISSYNQNALSFSSNIFDLFGVSTLRNCSVAEVKEDLAAGNSNTFFYQVKDAGRYATYMPLGINDWMIFTIVPQETVQGQMNHYTQLVVSLSLKFLVLFLISVIFLLIKEDRANKYLRLEKQRYEFVESFTDSISLEGDRKKDLLFFNKEETIFGEKIPFRHLEDFKLLKDYIEPTDYPLYEQCVKEILGGAEQAECEVRIIRPGREPKWYCMRMQTVCITPGKPHKIYGRIFSIDKHKRETIKFRRSSEMDALSNLYNRQTMIEQINIRLDGESQVNRHAFLLMDIDDFKGVNDQYGHCIGDAVICSVADALRESTEQTEGEKTIVVGRLGGDEFMLFIENIETKEEVVEIATKLCERVAKIRVDTMETGISCSIGGALYPENGRSFEALYQYADVALYEVKKSGKNNVVLF